MKKKKISLILYLVLLFSLIASESVLSWDDKQTHRDLSGYAADNSVLSISNGNYLNNIGIENGLQEYFDWGYFRKPVREWILDGSRLEDAGFFWQMILGTGRSFNHFHKPILTPWDTAGLNDIYTGQSSLRWAQNKENNQQNFREGDWSWQKVREYFYIALTGKDFTGLVVAPDKAKRDENFARTFRGLGHQMHLIQDAAQPDHARNDAHPQDSLLHRNWLGNLYFETWAAKYYSDINSFAAVPQSPNVSLNIPITGYVPITQFIDANQYDGSNPTNSLVQGIAEYTNANFFSDSTIFAAETKPIGDKHYFPYPKKTSTDLQSYESGGKPPETVIGEDNVPDTAFWIAKTADGETDIDHFVKPTYYTRNLLGVPNLAVYYSTFYRDETCHRDYAQQLVPRAVGYSTGLINYFFRGQIEAVNLALTSDGSGNVTGVRSKVRNNTPGESMEWPGKFVVSYRYIPYGGTDPVYGVSNDVALAENIASGAESITEYVFTFTNSVPSNATDVKYWLVFKGKLGNENDAVVGTTINRVYIGHFGSNDGRVWVVDLTSFTKTGPFTADSYQLFSVATDEINVFFATYGYWNSYITKFDKKGTWLGSINVNPPQTNGIQAMVSDGTFIYASGDYLDDTYNWETGITKFDADTLSVVGSVADASMDNFSGNADIDGTYGYFAATKNSGGGVVKVDLSALTILETLPLSTYPSILVVDKKRNCLYVGEDNSVTRKLYKVDLSTFDITGSIVLSQAASSMGRAVIQGNYLYVTTFPSTYKLLKIDLDLFQEVASMTLPGFAGATIANEKHIFVAVNYGATGNGLLQIDPSTMAVTNTLQLSVDSYVTIRSGVAVRK